jgi:3-methylcrotonyl-CoA carboxylase alpha subunit
MTITKILIANRGEIASRIIRTCRKMGIATVVVYAIPDAALPFVLEADEAVALNGYQASESYLMVDKIIAAAHQTQADAVHPGFGFLSENASFATRCGQEGLLFIGPNPAAIASMGLKSTAKEIMEKNGVPVIKGYRGAEQTLEFLVEQALAIGFPVLIKAVAGGGGKGMRIAESEAALAPAILAAQQEAKHAFGHAELMLERYFSKARHIEFQIFGDQHGNAVHLNERECSVQRRYQKVLEESPAPGLTDTLRKKMGAAAITAAKAINYDNAGTVEFILDQDNAFYFLEVNTRLQVEHPVTEMVTGVDLVAWQILVAEGRPLPLTQEAIVSKGHALECRLYAEDALNDFLPCTGTVKLWDTPALEGIRYESGVANGTEVSIYYDPMLAKIISYDTNRPAAIRRMQQALRKLSCLGLTTNQSFLMHLLQHPQFIEAPYHTGFIKENYRPEVLKSQLESFLEEAVVAAFLYRWYQQENQRQLLPKLRSGWRNQSYQKNKLSFTYESREICLQYTFNGSTFDAQIGDQKKSLSLLACSKQHLRFSINGYHKSMQIAEDSLAYYVHHPQVGPIALSLLPRFPVVEKAAEKGDYKAPMPGEVLCVLVQQGDKVEQGQALVTLLSMKMENTIVANETGLVSEIYVQASDTVAKETLLIKII